MKYKFILVLLLFPCFMQAQIRVGDYFAQAAWQGSSDISATNPTGNSSDFRLQTLKLSIGRFINERHAFGIQVLGSYKGSEPYAGSKNYSYGLGFIHWYVHPISQKWGWGWSNEVNYREGRLSMYGSGPYMGHLQNLKLVSSPGVYGFLFPKVALNASFDLFTMDYTKHTNNAGSATTNELYEVNSFKINAKLPTSFNSASFQVKLIYFFNH